MVTRAQGEASGKQLMELGEGIEGPHHLPFLLCATEQCPAMGSLLSPNGSQRSLANSGPRVMWPEWPPSNEGGVLGM